MQVTANQQYKHYAAKQKSAGAVVVSFKDWLTKDLEYEKMLEFLIAIK